MFKRDDTNIVKRVNGVVKKILGSGEWKPFKENEDKQGLKKETHNIYEGDVFKHLFIWAVLMDRRNLAMLFWKKENNDYIYSALYASSLAKELAEKSSSESFVDQRTDLWESSRQYEDLAYNVMTEIYCKNKNRARTLLMTEVEGYNYTTILEIAEKFTLMKFMGHAACQTRLDKIWKGEKLSYISNVKAIAAAFMPMLIMCFVNMVQINDNKVESIESFDRSFQHKRRPNWMLIYHFYNSPRIKFVFHLVAYMVMIVIFCLFILTDLHPMSDKSPSIYEYMVYAMAGSLMIEEIRQAFVIKQMSRNLMNWFSFWTLYEIVMYGMFLTSVFLRLILSADKFYHTRMMYAITLGLFIVNGMQFFLASRHIGPKVIMIGRMMYDILFFILIFAVFVFGFGVVYQATMYPNSKVGFQLFKEIIYMPYWQLYGELFYRNSKVKNRPPVRMMLQSILKGILLDAQRLIKSTPYCWLSTWW
ncbi:transient receptor potential cation channel subfamily M member 1-like [Mytilus trossulus]|uniref:transient receptor potential cation channel subfamily M member 1-like n=1 Tax=Mytilus trossulus TaxID=6551 RepID=UPI00300576BF